MKIVVCSQSDTSKAMVDSRFGRTTFWAIWDTQSQQWAFLPNEQNLQAAQGAGIQAAQAVLDTEANVLIACNVGPKAMTVLLANGIEVYLAQADIALENAIKAFEDGQLKRIENANVEGHWA
jgi:predicted Fe-Mo cluster-binding NifX family protein